MWREETVHQKQAPANRMTDLSHLTPSDLRRLVRTLDREADKFHRAARWLLFICCLEAALIVWLLLA